MSRYVFDFESPVFEAHGLDAAHRIAQRLTEILNDAVRSDREVLEVLEPGYARGTTPRCVKTSSCIANLHDHGCPKR